MVPNATRFQLDDRLWSSIARLGELSAVLSPGSSERRNLFLHAVTLVGARAALRLAAKRRANNGILVDFGCGTGRFVRFFGAKGYSVIGVDITPEMLSEARRFGLPQGSELHLIDGVSLPFPDQSVNIIWVCGVLKFSLFAPGSVCRGGSGLIVNEPFTPVYYEIAREMFRVLKLGGLVVNVEMYVDAQPQVFNYDFERAGFVTEQVRVLHRYGRLDKFSKSPRLPLKLVTLAGRLSATLRFWFDNPARRVSGLRDYFFVFSKPPA